MRLARRIITYWYGHNLDYIESICTGWKRGYILERLKWEGLSASFNLLAWLHGYQPAVFLDKIVREIKEEQR